MNYNHLFADDAGQSRWQSVGVELIEREFAPPAKAIEISEPIRSTNAFFLRLRAGWDESNHVTPIWQTLVCLRGEVRVTASDGDERIIGPGDVWMMQDTKGAGHRTEVISDVDFECMIIQHE